MKLPKTPEELVNEIFNSSDQSGDLRLRQLLKILDKVDPEIIVEGIIRVFENTSRPDKLFRDQGFAGQILETINPKSQKELDEILKRTLINWNKSIEQLPFWLRNNYGLDNVREAFDKIEFNDDTDKLETMKYWLQLNKSNL